MLAHPVGVTQATSRRRRPSAGQRSDRARDRVLAARPDSARLRLAPPSNNPLDYPRALVAVDLVVFTIIDTDLKLLVIERGEVRWVDIGEPAGSAPAFRRPEPLISLPCDQRLKARRLGIIRLADCRVADAG